MISLTPVTIALVLGVSSDPYFRTRAEAPSPQAPQHCLWWTGGAGVVFRQNEVGNPATPTGQNTEVFAAVTRSWQTWQAIMNDCGSLTISEGPRTNDRTIGYDSSNPSANQNVVLFRQRSCNGLIPATATCTPGTGDCGNAYDCWDHLSAVIALTTTTYDKNTGRIFDSDIELNGRAPNGNGGFIFTTVDSPRCPSQADYSCVAADIQNTATHEFGHALGLDHTTYPIFDACDPGCPASMTLYTHSTMYDRAPPGDLCKRCVDSASRQFVCDVYPKGKAAQDCLPKSGCSAAPGGPMLVLSLLALQILRNRRARR